ncbi:hypothetical protein Tdes44962_MAKER05779 [Teratosphaeria destructans]|uniref:rRNA-processing protein FYV7 n=1 Tax=Teratosphaeria destructans TaxID=418781 RepID=A0A9W7VYE7_9PEZI|nr:hypothetical protein Tdes44962_MAKER05779 [Teratosphaeria destructans]
MAEKRKREDGGAPRPDYRPGAKKLRQQEERKKRAGGFRVGPQNLPDGTYRRKTQEIKRSLIEKAQIKKEYAKLKKTGNVLEKREELPIPASLRADEERERKRAQAMDVSDSDEGDDDDVPEHKSHQVESSSAPHPDRQSLIDNQSAPSADEENQATQDHERAPRRDRRDRKPKVQPFKREHEAALKRKAEAEQRRQAREEAERERQKKVEEREKFRKAMAKARTGGSNGQRKLGRESTVLLERVKRMVGS